jgi:hypothetical protein
MNREDIIRMAREAGLHIATDHDWMPIIALAYAQKFAELVAAAAEREWQGLTNEEILEEYRQAYGDDGDLTDVYFARAIEAALKAKNA